MSLIQYQQATYATQMRDQLEMAGCEARVAALLARTVGELIDHVSQTQSDFRRELQDRDMRASLRATDVAVYKRDLFDRFIGVTLFVLAVAVVGGVLIALLR